MLQSSISGKVVAHQALTVRGRGYSKAWRKPCKAYSTYKTASGVTQWCANNGVGITAVCMCMCMFYLLCGSYVSWYEHMCSVGTTNGSVGWGTSTMVVNGLLNVNTVEMMPCGLNNAYTIQNVVWNVFNMCAFLLYDANSNTTQSTVTPTVAPRDYHGNAMCDLPTVAPRDSNRTATINVPSMFGVVHFSLLCMYLFCWFLSFGRMCGLYWAPNHKLRVRNSNLLRVCGTVGNKIRAVGAGRSGSGSGAS